MTTPLEKLLSSSKAPDYDKIHHWLRKNFGTPNYCEDKRCLGHSSRYDWALKRGEIHAKVRANYLRLCRKCHIRYDWTPARRNHWFKITHTLEAHRNRSIAITGRKLSHEQKELVRMVNSKPVARYVDGKMAEIFSSMTEAAKAAGVSLPTVSLAIIEKRSDKHGNLWKKI